MLTLEQRPKQRKLYAMWLRGGGCGEQPSNAKTQGGREPVGKFEAQHRGIYTETTAGSGEDERGFKFPCYT